MIIDENMTISELARRTDVPATTIRFYLNEGLITPPVKKGKTRAYYNNDHVIQLNKLKYLRTTCNFSIDEIKKNYAVSNQISGNTLPDQPTGQDRKDDIMAAAIELFRTKGYDTVSLNDIAERASISKATFYKYFSNKEDLFYECADKVFYEIDEEFKELLSGQDVLNRMRIRTSYFVKSLSHMIDMLQIVRDTSSEAGQGKKLIFNRILNNLTAPIVHDLEEGVRLGLFRSMNTTIVAHLLLGAVEYGIYFCADKSKEDTERYITQGMVLIMQGGMQNSSGDNRLADRVSP